MRYSKRIFIKCVFVLGGAIWQIQFCALLEFSFNFASGKSNSFVLHCFFHFLLHFFCYFSFILASRFRPLVTSIILMFVMVINITAHRNAFSNNLGENQSIKQQGGRFFFHMGVFYKVSSFKGFFFWKQSCLPPPPACIRAEDAHSQQVISQETLLSRRQTPV